MAHNDVDDFARAPQLGYLLLERETQVHKIIIQDGDRNPWTKE
jgi:hypothetical protein